jgi:hypothetical protein
MLDRGIEPFEILPNKLGEKRGGGWRLEPTNQVIERNLALNKIRNQIRRSSCQQRYYVESIDPSVEPLAYIQATTDLGLTQVQEDIAIVALEGASNINRKNKQLLEQFQQQGEARIQAALVQG